MSPWRRLAASSRRCARHQQKPHQPAVVSAPPRGCRDRRRLARSPTISASVSLRVRLLSGARRMSATKLRRHHVLLRRPFHQRPEVSQEPVCRDHAAALVGTVPGGAQIGLGELCGRRRKPRVQVAAQRRHRVRQCLDARAFLDAQLLVIVDQGAERERGARVCCRRRYGRASLDALDQLAGGLARRGEAHCRVIAEHRAQFPSAGAVAQQPSASVRADAQAEARHDVIRVRPVASRQCRDAKRRKLLLRHVMGSAVLRPVYVHGPYNIAQSSATVGYAIFNDFKRL